MDIKWDKTAEVIVVGYGLAGAVAALSAHDKGASVIILEKQKADSHCTCSSMSGGVFVSPSDANGAAEYMAALSQRGAGVTNWTDMNIIRTWADYTVQNKDWMLSLGAKIKFHHKGGGHPQLPGADSIESWQYPGLGIRMMQFMYDQLKSRKVEVLYQTPAQRLITNEGGEIIGVKATRIDGEQNEAMFIKASRAVILCTGGFEENDEMKLQYLRVYPAYFTGSTANTGDGIKMAQEVGADLWHMSCTSASLVAKFPDFPIAFRIDFRGGMFERLKRDKAPAGFIIVDKHGRRYPAETYQSQAGLYELTQFDSVKLEYPRIPSYYIFDKRRMDYGRLCVTGASGPHQLHKWSMDNMIELRRGWIISGQTLAGLASKIELDTEVLVDTVQRWNRYCEEGIDREFGRDPKQLVPLDSPPFYAIKMFPGGPNTQGGPRRNSRAQVVNPFGEPIPGLYAAGECGSVYGLLYPVSGSNLAECIAFGRIAADNAVKEKIRG